MFNNIKCNISINSNKYYHNNIQVPRVTEILSSMLHEESLMGWSNYLGFKKKRYSAVLSISADIGTYTHGLIEDYLSNGFVILNTIPPRYRFSVENAFLSFVNWYNILLQNDINILGLETQLTCEWFGGTYDMLISINNKTYLVDFKTSNHISYKHFIQASAYKYMLELNNIYIDGIIILQLNKDTVSFNEYIIHLDNNDHKIFMDSCLDTFKGIVYGYYYRKNTEDLYNKIF